jgi:hypothetical protein
MAGEARQGIGGRQGAQVTTIQGGAPCEVFR